MVFCLDGGHAVASDGREGSADPVLGLVTHLPPLGHVELEIHVLVR